MKFAAVIEYITDTAKIAEVRPAHREYLSQLQSAGQLVGAGPFLDDFGALIIYEAPDAATAERLITADPFHTAGVFVRWTVRPWKMVFATPALMPGA
jgi:uncharacterized protein